MSSSEDSLIQRPKNASRSRRRAVVESESDEPHSSKVSKSPRQKSKTRSRAKIEDSSQCSSEEETSRHSKPSRTLPKADKCSSKDESDKLTSKPSRSKSKSRSQPSDQGSSLSPTKSKPKANMDSSSEGSDFDTEILESQLEKLLGGNSKKKEFVVHDSEEYASLLTEEEAKAQLKVSASFLSLFYSFVSERILH